MYKFKIGDKVVISNWPYSKVIGERDIVVEVFSNEADKRVRVYVEKYGLFEATHLELEEVYDSPLYKALR